MRSKKSKSSNKTVAIAVDAEALHKLRGAAEALSDFAGAYEMAVGDRR
jgi:hypothetical protein